MYQLYKEIVKQLEPYKDKVFFQPLKKNELALLENNIGQHFPEYYRQFLLSFGMQQDFVYELIKQEQDFVAAYSYLPECYKKTFVPIADNGGEEIWLIKTADNKDRQLYQWQAFVEDEIVPLGLTFNELIQKNIEELRDNHINKASNASKKWCVQFSITTNNETMILEAIDAVKTNDWAVKEAYLGGVHCYEMEIVLAASLIKLYKHEFDGWDSSAYYFDFNEPTNSIGKNSFIKKLDKQLKEKFNQYRLIDYGILPIGN